MPNGSLRLPLLTIGLTESSTVAAATGTATAVGGNFCVLDWRKETAGSIQKPCSALKALWA